MNLTELLSKEMKTDKKYICTTITTLTDIYHLCFIEYEDHEKIGAYITGEDGAERFLIIYKDHIVAVQVVYEQDIKLLKNEDNSDVMINQEYDQ